jgi:hypothetical protein
MSGKKLSVVTTGDQEQAPALRNVTKPFDDFASTAKSLGETYLSLRKSLKEADDSCSTSHKLERLTKRLEYAKMCGRYAKPLATCEQFLEQYDELSDDDARYRVEIGKKVAQLVGCYGNANVGDPEVFVRTLIDDVAGAEESLVIVEAAFRKLRRSQKFLPAIAEVLAALSEESAAWAPRFSAIWGGVEDMIEQLESKRTELEQKLLAEQERKRLMQEAAARNSVAWPVGTRVGHKQHGLGTVERHYGDRVEICFGPPEDWRRWLRLSILPEELLRLAELGDGGRVGDPVFHEKFGAGVISEEWGSLVSVVEVAFSGGKREVLRSRLVQVVPGDAQPEPLALDHRHVEPLIGKPLELAPVEETQS